MKHILILLTVLLLFSTCKKEEKATLYMSGYIYNNCYDREPYRNGKIRLYRTNNGVNQNGKVVAIDSTDENGYFKIYFPPAHHVNVMKLQTGNGGDLMYGIPPNVYYDDIEVFFSPTSTIRVNLNVLNPYTNNDTLFITDFNNIYTKLKVPGPFQSGVLYTANNFGLLTPNYQNTPMNIGYRINDGDGIIKDFFLNSCMLSEVTVDIN